MRFRLLFPVVAALAVLFGFRANTLAGDSGPTGKVTAEKQTKVIDVRTAAEYESGHLKGAINIPVDDLEKRIQKVVPDKATRLQVHCKSGRRSAIAKNTLERLGYKNVEDLGSFANAQKVIEGK